MNEELIKLLDVNFYNIDNARDIITKQLKKTPETHEKYQVLEQIDADLLTCHKTLASSLQNIEKYFNEK